MTNKNSVKKGFGRAAPNYEQIGILQREVRQELLQRFEYFQIKPERILDLGCGTGAAIKPLAKLFSGARIIGVDIAFDMLRHNQSTFAWLRKNKARICADMDTLPFADASMDCIFSSLALQWSPDPLRALQECQRVLKPGGLLHMATLGTQTLYELRACFEQVGDSKRVMPFHDVQRWGSALVDAGFEHPVLDVDRRVLHFENGQEVMRHLKGIGATNHRQDRPDGLTGRSKLQQVIQDYEQFRQANGVPASFEVIYAHAWKSEQVSGSLNELGEVRIDPAMIGRRGR